MRRIHIENFVPKYTSGKFVWNQELDRIVFESFKDENVVTDEYVETGGYKFKSSMNQVEELIFRQEFQRSDLTYDSDVILVNDIINVALYLAPSEIVTQKFINFVHTETVERLLRALIVYFEYYLKMVEFVLVRRDEISGPTALIQTKESTELKRVLSSQLIQYRLMVAREYCTILLGQDEMATYHHIAPIVNISKSIADRFFHESFLAFATQVVWIAMHRHGFDYIELEMNRLFRSEHFKLKRYAKLSFTRAEESFLYGKNYRRINYRAQKSPLIQEISNIRKEDKEILWFGERKYRGTDLRIHELELEYIVPDSQLMLVDVSHGILGHPKKLYNTVLKICTEAVRLQHYTQDYDPYQLVTQPHLKIPKIDEEKVRKYALQSDSFFTVKRLYERPKEEVIQKWYQRDKLNALISAKTSMLVDVWSKCEKEVADTSYGPSVKEILDKFLARKELLRKKK